MTATTIPKQISDLISFRLTTEPAWKLWQGLNLWSKIKALIEPATLTLLLALEAKKLLMNWLRNWMLQVTLLPVDLVPQVTAIMKAALLYLKITWLKLRNNRILFSDALKLSQLCGLMTDNNTYFELNSWLKYRLSRRLYRKSNIVKHISNIVSCISAYNIL